MLLKQAVKYVVRIRVCCKYIGDLNMLASGLQLCDYQRLDTLRL
jgi:hypothetical protein